MKNRRYGKALALIAFLGGAILASPGCSSEGDTCAGVADKICDKACACGSSCIVGAGGTGLETGSKFLCVPLYTSGCANQMGIDYHACSIALDTAKCEKEALLVPTECTSPPSGGSSSSGGGGGGGSGGGGGGASGSTGASSGSK